VVPMNALLQHRGQTLLSGGRSIAVQNFNENLSVLVTLGLYAVLIQQDWPWPALILGLSIWMGLPMVAILIVTHRQGLRRLAP
jgi:LPLT family lysophospholipid transporter-like MFS transporter